MFMCVCRVVWINIESGRKRLFVNEGFNDKNNSNLRSALAAVEVLE